MTDSSRADVEKLRIQLKRDAEKAKTAPEFAQRQEWINPQLWSQYMGTQGKLLYQSFSDEELLDIIRQETAVLGRIPAQREVFCVYREYIRRRFGNWIKALRAAGLKEEKVKPAICANQKDVRGGVI